MGNISRVGVLLVSSSALILAAVTPAQAADASTSSAAASGTQTTLEEVIVTAQRREQSLQNVAMPVTAVSGATLQQAGVTDVQGLSSLVPALQVVQTLGSGNQSYHIRGIGSDANTPTFEPDVALFIDDVYLPRSGLSVDDLADLARVEVLEGPQSTLYGKNATAGVINILTKPPSAMFEGSVEDSISELESSKDALVNRFATTVSGPLNDRLRARLSVVTYDQGASYRNLEPGVPDANDMNRYSIRGEVEADLWSDTTLRVAALRSEVYDTRSGDPDLLYYSGANDAAVLDHAFPLAFPAAVAGLTLPCPDNNPNDRTICTSSPWRSATHSNVLSATLKTKIGANSLTSITALSDYGNELSTADAAQIIVPLVGYYDIQKGGTFSQEFRLTSPDGEKLEWLVGAYALHTGFARGNDGRTPTFVLEAGAPDVPLPGVPGVSLGHVGDEGFLNSKSRSDYLAVFGQSTYHFTDQFSATVGLRGQTEEKHASIDNSYVMATAPHVVPGCFPSGLSLISALLTPICTTAGAPIDGDFSHQTSNLTWNATGEYHPAQGLMLYVTASHGAKSFGYNVGFGNAALSTRPFKDEEVTNLEGGAKSTLWDGRVNLSASVFHADYHNYQNAGFVGAQFLVNNADKVSVNGFDANGVVALGHGLTASGGATYVDAKYDSYVDGACFTGEAANNGAGGCNLSGMDLPTTPHWRTTVGLQYKQATQLGDFYSRLDWAWQSSELTDSNLDPRSLQEAYSLVNGRVGISLDNGFDLSLWGKNLFNKTYSMEDAVSTLFGTADPEFQRFLGRPRELGLTVRKAF